MEGGGRGVEEEEGGGGSQNAMPNWQTTAVLSAHFAVEGARGH